MRVIYSDRFRRSYESVPPHIQRAFERRLEFLFQNLRHPSLQAKKYDEARDIWQARVTRGGVFISPLREIPTISTTSFLIPNSA
jgi:mRNA-degrading endonuclease RelE of RelBE toxin-antitoxin system